MKSHGDTGNRGPISGPRLGPLTSPSPWWDELPRPLDDKGEPGRAAIEARTRTLRAMPEDTSQAERGVQTMRARLISLFAALAAIFLVAGASAKY